MTPQETARAILELYDGKPERWTQRWLARNAAAVSVSPTSRHAVCWCIAGAAEVVLKTGESYDRESYVRFREAAAALTENKHDAWWNDAPERTFADVVALLEKIASEPAPEPPAEAP
jgi:hypothetical protein